LHSLSTHPGGKAVDFLKRMGVPAAGVLAVALVGLTACAALDRRPPEAIVKERSQARWDALVKSDVKAAYGYLSPGSRTITTPEAYEGGIRKGFWKSATVDKVECAQQKCDVDATIEYEFQGRRTKTPLRETWIQEGSNWWYVQK
jgi:hypothetical protein